MSTIRRHCRHGALAVCCAGTLVALLASCSGDAPTAGGGSDLPNGAVAALSGSLFLPDSSEAAGAEVWVRQVVITAQCDSVTFEQQAVCDAHGRYAFDSIPQGAYSVYGLSADRSLKVLYSFVELATDHERIVEDLYLRAPVDVIGYIQVPPGLLLQSMDVLIPGTSVGMRINVDRGVMQYVLNGAPAGYYDVAFVYGEAVDFMTVRVWPEQGQYAVRARDVRFAMLDIMADTAASFHPTTTERCFYVSPVSYPQGTGPAWYRNADFSGMRYYQHSAEGTRLWVDDSLGDVQQYDTTMAGTFYRDSLGRVVLEFVPSQFVVLTGDRAAARASSIPRFAVVAARRIETAGEIVWEVLDIQVYGTLSLQMSH